MADLTRLSATEVAGMLARREICSEELVMASLARIEERDDVVGAWAYVDGDVALRQAREADRQDRRSALHGIPYGAKDVIDTAGMPTERGSRFDVGRRPSRDADCIARMRRAGAILIGKTVTTEYAMYHPNQTRNPLNLEHTPGGSSSGSAAAVADLMVPLAFANQTAGSLIRPAAYCGICGFKPTQGLLDLSGILAMEPTFDALGYMARSFDDIGVFHQIVGGGDVMFRYHFHRPPRVGLCRTYQWPLAEAGTIAAIDGASVELARLGAEVNEVELPPIFADLPETHTTLLQVGLARNLAAEYEAHADAMSPRLREFIEEGIGCPAKRHRAAMAHARECRELARQIFGDHDVLLTPTASGEAPVGIETTGSPIFQVSWTLLQVPIATIPGSTGPNGLPVGVQFVGRPGDDDSVLELAAWFHESRKAHGPTASLTS